MEVNKINTEIRKKLYIKLSYSLLDWEWYDDANTMRVFIHLLLTANRKAQPYHGDIIRRGEALASVEFLADSLKMSTKNVRTALAHLKKTGEVAIRKIGKTSVIRVLSFDKYQSGGNETAMKWHQNGNEAATTRHHGGNEGATPINCNTEDNEDNVIMKECEKKRAHGKFKNVFLTDSQYQKFRSEYPLIADEITEQLSLKIAADKNAYSDNHLAYLYIFAKNYKAPKKDSYSGGFSFEPVFDYSSTRKYASRLDLPDDKQ